MPRSPYSSLRFALAIALAPFAAFAEEVPGAGELLETDAAHELYLEVVINGRPTGLIAKFQQQPDGTISADATELQEIGLAPGPAAIGPDGSVALEDIAGLTYDYDAASQRLLITAGMGALATRDVRLRERRPVGELETPIWSAFVNYNFFGSAGREHEEGITGFDGLSVALDANLSGPYGTLSSDAIAGLFEARDDEVIRLDTRYEFSDPERMIRYRAGDTIAGGLSWTRPVRLGGVQVERDFSLRPDLVTRPLPSFSGTAEVPSTLEIYSENVKVFSGEIEPGPFDLADIPVVTDSGAAQVVLVDAQGRTVVAHLPFFTSSEMLRPGLAEFSVEAGWPRRSFGVSSFDYSGGLFGSATGRYGVTERLTVEGHAEAGAELLNAGAGAVFSFSRRLLGSAHVAGSSSEVGTGMQVGGSAQIDLGPARLYGRSIRRFGDFWDIAAASAKEAAFDDSAFSAAPPTAINQLGLSTGLGFDPAQLSINYTQQEGADESTTSIGSVSLSRSLWNGASLHVSGFQDLEATSNFGAFASVSFPLGEDIRGQTGTRIGPEGATLYGDVYNNFGHEPGDVGWRVRAAAGEEQRIAAEARRWASFGQMRGAVDLDGNRVRAEADLDGAVVIGAGGAHLSRRIHDSFAIVDAGAEDVDVLYQNRPVGRTGANGQMVVPYLRGYETNRISIEAADLPAGVIIETDSREVVPPGGAGVFVGFGAEEKGSAAIVVLVDSAGEPLPAGSEILRSGQTSPVLIGYGGEAYLTDLQGREELDVRLSGGRRCRATLEYQPSSEFQPRIEGIVCQ